MANINTVNKIKRKLDDSWNDSTKEIQRQIEDVSERVKPPKGKALTEQKVQTIVDNAIKIEATERAQAIAASVVVELLNIIENLEGRIEILEAKTGDFSFSTT